MKLNKKGFTLIELIVSLGLLSIIMVFMINLFMEARLMFNDSRNISMFETDKRYIIKTLSTDLSDYTIESVNATDEKIDFTFKELGTTKTLEIQKSGNKTYLFYGCKTACNNQEKLISNYKKLLPEGSVVGKFSFRAATEITKFGWVKLPITVAGKTENLNVYYSYKEVDTYESYFMVDKLQTMVKGSNENSTEVINKGTDSATGCTQTLAYDGTVDNNLRYVGKNPCNYVVFNDERPGTETIYRIVNKATGEDAWGEMFENLASCNAVYTPNFASNYNNYECRALNEVMGRWRIIGIMNNVDDGTGRKETRIKLVRNEYIGLYSWDVSTDDGFETNDWSQAALKNELNGDYLNANLSANTMWWDGHSTGGKVEFDYTKRLKASAQAQIGDVKWHLGGMTTEMNNLIPSTMYTKERGTEVYGNPTGTCNDGACPRATSWTGKVALIYPSDYGFATAGGATTSRNSCVNNLPLYWDNSLDSWTNSRYNDCKLNNWIPVAPLHRTLTPLSNDKYGLQTIYLAGSIGSLGAAYPRPVFPSVYLKSSVVTTGGSGTVNDPYILS